MLSVRDQLHPWISEVILPEEPPPRNRAADRELLKIAVAQQVTRERRRRRAADPVDAQRKPRERIPEDTVSQSQSFRRIERPKRSPRLLKNKNTQVFSQKK